MTFFLLSKKLSNTHRMLHSSEMLYASDLKQQNLFYKHTSSSTQMMSNTVLRPQTAISKVF